MNVTAEDLNNYTRGMANSGIQPKQDDVNSICDIAGISAVQAVILLKKWPSLADALAHYFDNPSDALREDVSSRQWEPQDNIPYADDHVGMSRPSSPANYIDLTADHAKATALQDEDEENIRKAISESMRDVSKQENGTITSGQHFGPAQRSSYPASQWALAPIASAREVVEHPPPIRRQRVPGQPAFLRGSPETGYNAALLNIYHSIPLAREALIFPPLKISSYGHNLDWWSGTSDENLKHLSLQEVLPGQADKRRFAAEIQCLMAFLDNTARAYGSVDALSEMNYYQYTTGDTSTSKLFEAWRRASVEDFPDEPLSQVFTTVATRGPEVQGALPEEKDMLQIEGNTYRVQTQSEFLDKLVWVDTWKTPPEDVWMESFGHILTLRLHNPEPGATGLGIVPDQVWYLDRYMPQLREAMLKIRQKRCGLYQAIERLDRVDLRLTEMPPLQDNAPKVQIKSMLEAAKGLVSVATSDATPLEDRDRMVDRDVDTVRIQGQLEALLKKVQASLDFLGTKRVELEEQVKVIMSDLRDPETSLQPLRHKYMLHGVSTKPNITYLRKLNQDLIGLEDQDEPHEVWQWWRMAWNETPEPANPQPDAQSGKDTGITDGNEASVPFSVSRVSYQAVLNAVQNESTSAVLVYADETALTLKPEPLPASLRDFVERDNQAFEDEISTQHGRNSAHSRGRSNGTDSTIMDDADPFDDTSYTYNREFTPMSTSTIRSLSGQPSPKRPRSSDSMQNMNLMDDPPAYEDIAEPSQEEAVQNKGSKIGYFAEQMLHSTEEHDSKK